MRLYHLITILLQFSNQSQSEKSSVHYKIKPKFVRFHNIKEHLEISELKLIFPGFTITGVAIRQETITVILVLSFPH